MRTRSVLYLTCIAALLCVSAQRPQAGQRQDDLVEGVDLRVLLRAALPSDLSVRMVEVRRRGVFARVAKQGEYVGSVELGVFADRASAAAIFEEHLRFRSLVPVGDPTGGKIGDKCVGGSESAWLWRRGNVVVSMSIPANLVPAAAAAMDKAFVSGSAGVRRGTTVPVPRIVDVELPARIIAGTTAPIKVTVALREGANRDLLGIADACGVSVGSSVLERGPPREVRLTYTLRYAADRLRERREEHYWICYATAGCAVTSKKVTIRIEPR